MGVSAQLVLFLALISVAASVDLPPVPISPAPAWIDPINPDTTSRVATDQVSGGVYSVLFDLQDNEILDPPEIFVHLADRIVNEQGVPDGSRIAISFDPSYQELTLHSVLIHRAGTTIHPLDHTRVQVIQRESQLEYQIIDGAHTALMLLEDVRPGDVVEYSYSLRGRNPAMAGHYSNSLVLAMDVPMRRIECRLIWPPGRPLSVRSFGTSIAPRIERRPDRVDYRWSRERVGAVKRDGDLPPWYDPYPRVRLSSLQSWGEVASWAAGLFREEAEPGAALRQKVDEIRGRYPDPEHRALAAILFVQDEVRYLGIEFGQGSLRPASPSVVAQRRFGDCKDKAFLLVTMLRQLGIQADPALVNAWRGDSIATWAPTTAAFNHAIVRIRLDGASYWIDPTIQGQRGGSLARLYVPDYGSALVVDPGAVALTAIGAAERAHVLTFIHKVYEATDVHAPAMLTVDTYYHGRDADIARRGLHRTSRDEAAKNFLRFYTQRDPEIEAVDSLTVGDDEDEDIVHTVERYSIPNFWKPIGAEGRRMAHVEPAEIRQRLKKPNELHRSMPLGIEFPQHFVCVTEVRGPFKWTIPPDSTVTEGEAFRAVHRERAREHTLSLYDEYETLKDAIPPSACADHVRELDAAGEAMQLNLQTGADPKVVSQRGGVTWWALVLVLAVLAASVTVAVRVYHAASWSPPPVVTAAMTLEDGVSGLEVSPASDVTEPGFEPMPPRIGGWLVLFAFGVFLSPLTIARSVSQSMLILRRGTMDALLLPAARAANPLQVPLVVFEACANSALLVAYVLAVILLVQRRRILPRYWIGLAVTNILVTIMDQGAASLFHGTEAAASVLAFGRLLGAILGTAVWSQYLMKSKRVKDTFVR